MTSDLQVTAEENSSDCPKSVAPSLPRDLHLELASPTQVVISNIRNKVFHQTNNNLKNRLGYPRPLYYSVEVDSNKFERCITQSKSQDKDFCVSVGKLLPLKQYKVTVRASNDELQGQSTYVVSIYTNEKPSRIQNLSVKEGVITFDPPTYKGYGDLVFDLMMFDQSATDDQDNVLATQRDSNESKSIRFDLNALIESNPLIVIDKEKTTFRIRMSSKQQTEDRKEEKDAGRDDVQRQEMKERDPEDYVYSPVFHYHEEVIPMMAQYSDVNNAKENPMQKQKQKQKPETNTDEVI
ncbi:hypothetical protein RFI_13054, partial [Reticulomyxa filosa]